MSKLQLDTATANRLIDLLSTDDDFRKLFASDTLAALQEAGAEPTDELKEFVAKDCAKVTLADKETIAGARKEITTMLTSGVGHSVPMLDAGHAGTRPLK
jgi:hypothetical protein